MSTADLPYDGTEGFSGTDTSEARARSEAVSGVASVRQRYVLIQAARAGVRGVTVAELRDDRLHHGRISGTLSVLHKVGKLVRLRETRDKCKVYVLPEFVDGRQTETFGRVRKADPETLAAAERVEKFLRRYEDDGALFDPPLDHATDTFNRALWRLVNYAQGRTE
jgi:hypothetical protein